MHVYIYIYIFYMITFRKLDAVENVGKEIPKKLQCFMNVFYA